ncbi:MAG TPA: helix-turn-helix transcriptional regulator [Ignavibacteriaceae bacterium]
MNLGGTIKFLRQQKGFNQKDFARECDITPTYLSQIETNQKEPNLSKLHAIASTLNLPLPILFFLSLTAEDINPEKRNAYNMLGPSVKSLINEFFINAKPND